MANIAWTNEQRRLSELIPWPRNPRQIRDTQVRRLQESLEEFGQPEVIAIGPGNEVYNGHQRLKSWAAKFGDIVVDVRVSSRALTEKEREKLTVFLHRGTTGEWDFDMLANEFEMAELVDWGFDPAELGLLDDGEVVPAETRPTLADRFLVPPFSVLDARQGYWQDRKSAWIALGIQSELGRGQNALDMSATMAGITDPEERAAWNTQRRESPRHQGTLGAIAPNEAGNDGILARTGKYAARANATPGGSPRPAANLGQNGKTQRGDGRGRTIKGKRAAVIGGAPLPLDRTANGKSLARTFGQDLMRGKHVVGENRLTWVAGDRDRDELDDTSRKILAAGRRHGYPHGPTVTRNPDGTLRYRGASRDQWLTESDGNEASGTSIFDPVLCELAYTWFCPPAGSILDPFAGGSVRGIVAAKLGRKYTGIDLRPEQVMANEAQAVAIVPDNKPRWIVGDSRDAQPDERFDFVFSCPPYYDLEIYSDDPADLSNMDWLDFLAAYRVIIHQAVARLNDNRFACFVVGDVRDKNGHYRNFVSETITAFQNAGAILYNEAILVTAVGSLPIRVGKQFSSGRKLGKTHQNVLVFVKGDWRQAVADCGQVEIVDLNDYMTGQTPVLVTNAAEVAR